MVMNVQQGTSSFNLKKMLEKDVKNQITMFKDNKRDGAKSMAMNLPQPTQLVSNKGSNKRTSVKNEAISKMTKSLLLPKQTATSSKRGSSHMFKTPNKSTRFQLQEVPKFKSSQRKTTNSKFKTLFSKVNVMNQKID